MARDYDAFLIDLDGTLLNRRSEVPPDTREALLAAEATGVRVMVVTGRSLVATRPILLELGLSAPCVVFNGAAVWCPRSERFLEERTLSNRTLERTLAFGEARDDMTIVMQAGRKLALDPRNDIELRSLEGLHGLEFVTRAELRQDYTVRVTFISGRHQESDALEAEFLDYCPHPTYLTHFPLSILPDHERSELHALDVHPPCRGKAEALRFLLETEGIPSERIVAVGDASNDDSMIQAAGLGVAMADGMASTRALADRVIGGNDTRAVADLLEELFLS
ncbi:MAG: Cof subfamily protein (haloacid dehalogenase superfamily) [Planctomycetota bacterium]|jgi:Cof subfamily protein (haloacid dehalogenase superfamily)